MGLAQAQDAQAGAVAVLRMDAPFEDGLDHPGGVRPGLLGPADQPISRCGVHSACSRWLLGMCSVSVLCRPLCAERRWLATRWLAWKHSTVRAVRRTSSCCFNSW